MKAPMDLGLTDKGPRKRMENSGCSANFKENGSLTDPGQTIRASCNNLNPIQNL